VATAGTAGTVTEAAQPNITSVGTLSGLTVTGIAAANYLELNTNTASAPAVNAAVTRPADGTIAFIANSAERIRIASAGQIGIAGANYGTSGQVLTSGGTSAAPTWSDPAGAGATGGGSDKVFIENDLVVTTDYSIPATKNAGTFGPITVNSGVTVTVPSGSTWSIV